MSLIAMPEPDNGAVRRRAEIIEDLAALIGRSALITDDDGRRAFETDALTAYRSVPLLVVLPRTTDEVSKVLRYCNDARVKVIPRGAGTSLCGGALPTQDAIVLCVSKMNRILEVDYANRFARVESGITNLAISNRVAEKGFFYAPDPSSQIACTLAGNLAMNSGGAHCLKYGVTTNNVLGLKMVLIDGTVIDIGGAHLETPGYDMMSYAIGSEGQFVVITEATVRTLDGDVVVSQLGGSVGGLAMRSYPGPEPLVTDMRVAVAAHRDRDLAQREHVGARIGREARRLHGARGRERTHRQRGHVEEGALGRTEVAQARRDQRIAAVVTGPGDDEDLRLFVGHQLAHLLDDGETCHLHQADGGMGFLDIADLFRQVERGLVQHLGFVPVQSRNRGRNSSRFNSCSICSSRTCALRRGLFL